MEETPNTHCFCILLFSLLSVWWKQLRFPRAHDVETVRFMLRRGIWVMDGLYKAICSPWDRYAEAKGDSGSSGH